MNVQQNINLSIKKKFELRHKKSKWESQIDQIVTELQSTSKQQAKQKKQNVKAAKTKQYIIKNKDFNIINKCLLKTK